MKIFAENFGVNQKRTIFASQFQKANHGKVFPTARRKALHHLGHLPYKQEFDKMKKSGV